MYFNRRVGLILNSGGVEHCSLLEIRRWLFPFVSEHESLQFDSTSLSAADAWWTKTSFSLRFASLGQVDVFTGALLYLLWRFVVLWPLWPQWQKHLPCEQTWTLICLGYAPLALKPIALGFLYGKSICVPWVLLKPYVFLNLMWSSPTGCSVAAGIPCCKRDFWIPFGILLPTLFTWRLRMTVVIELSMVMLLPFSSGEIPSLQGGFTSFCQYPLLFSLLHLIS